MWIGLALVIALALSACGGAGVDPATARPTVDTSPLMNIPGRLLVLGTDGSVFTIAPDGSDRVMLARPGAGRASAQPTWSPDGTRVAWVDIELRRGLPAGRVAMSRADGSEQMVVETGTVSFFLAWDPTASRVAYLHGDAQSGIALGIVELADATPRVIARGQPLYVDWSPDGRQLFTHIGEDDLGYVALDGRARPLPEPAALFRAPEWRREDGRLTYAVGLPDGDALVARDRDGDLRELARFDGLIAFATSPDGRRVAYQVTALGDVPADQAGGSNIALTPEPAHAAQAPADLLAVVDVATGATTLVAEESVAAFFWSPTGERLLYLVAEETLHGILTRWSTWDDAGTVRLDAFAPSLEYARDHLPFFDQFARVSTPWSPDGTQFAYAGISEDGESGIWVQSADGAIPPILVADGAYVTWGP